MVHIFMHFSVQWDELFRMFWEIQLLLSFCRKLRENCDFRMAGMPFWRPVYIFVALSNFVILFWCSHLHVQILELFLGHQKSTIRVKNQHWPKLIQSCFSMKQRWLALVSFMFSKPVLKSAENVIFLKQRCSALNVSTTSTGVSFQRWSMMKLTIQFASDLGLKYPIHETKFSGASLR